MLSSEPEPSAFGMRDVTALSSPEKRLSLVSLGSVEASPSRQSDSEAGRLTNSESLHNLSLAIMRRQQLEAEEPLSSLAPPVAANALIDQVRLISKN